MQHIQLLSTLWLSGFFMYPSDHYFLWKHLKRRRREGRKRTHRGRMGRRESNRALFSFQNLGMVSRRSIIFAIPITTLKFFTQRRLQQSIYQCMNKPRRPLHSELTSKIQVQMTSLLIHLRTNRHCLVLDTSLFTKIVTKRPLIINHCCFS